MNSVNTQANIELTSACYDRKPVTGEHTLQELPLSGKINIRGDSANAEIFSALEKAISITPPVIPNTKVSNDNVTVYWMGPDEWLLVCDIDQVSTISEKIRQHLGTLHHAVTDVSDYYTVLQLSGPQSEALINRGCPQDLHPSVFPAGSITQTRFGHASILLDRQADETTWHIQVRWTYAEYLWDYLVSAMDAL